MSDLSFPTTAIVLAGGFGTRLQTVVSDVPKPLAPINGRPFLSILFDELLAQGIKHVILAVGYKGGMVETSFGESYKELTLSYSYEEEPLGTGGAIQLALKQHNSQQSVWIFNGDTYFGCSLNVVLEQHHRLNAEVTLALTEMETADRYGLVELRKDQFISRFCEKTPGASGLINAGVYLLEPESLFRFDLPSKFSLEKDFFEAFLQNLRIVGCTCDGFFIDIGVPEDYARAQVHWQQNT